MLIKHHLSCFVYNPRQRRMLLPLFGLSASRRLTDLGDSGPGGISCLSHTLARSAVVGYVLYYVKREM